LETVYKTMTYVHSAWRAKSSPVQAQVPAADDACARIAQYRPSATRRETAARGKIHAGKSEWAQPVIQKAKLKSWMPQRLQKAATARAVSHAKAGPQGRRGNARAGRRADRAP
jgi:hypothetical protein